jgi:hypothetical protein
MGDSVVDAAYWKDFIASIIRNIVVDLECNNGKDIMHAFVVADSISL